MRRCLALLGGLALILAAPACGHRQFPVPPKRSALVVTPLAAAPPQPRKAVHPKPWLPIAFPDLDTAQIGSVAFSADGRRLAFGYGRDAEVSLWNLETGRLEWQRHVDGANGGPLMFDPQGRFMIILCHDPDSQPPLWVCTLDGRLLRKLPGYLDDDFQLERAGRFLVIGGWQNISPGTRNVWVGLTEFMIRAPGGGWISERLAEMAGSADGIRQVYS